MLLKSITFNDFRCFRGTRTINLECGDDKNIIAILGDNTHGKSTIVLAFIWCFYDISNFLNSEIYNRAIARDLAVRDKTFPSVEVVFEHNNVLYTARRQQEFFKNIDGKMVCPTGSSKFTMHYVDNQTGETKPCGNLPSEHNKAINAILSKELASYFFFEGERDNQLTSKSLGSAVKTLMGIEPLIKMREHVFGAGDKVSAKSVISYYEKKLTDLSDEKVRTEWQRREQAEQDLESNKKRCDEIDGEIDNYNNKISDINDKLREAEPTRKLQQERDRIAADIKDEEKRLLQAQTRYINDFNENAVNLFTIPLLDSARKRLDAMDLSDKGIPGLDISVLKELLYRGKCLCGTKLDAGTLAYQSVEKYIDTVPPKSISDLVRGFQDKMDESDDAGKKYAEMLQSDYVSVLFSINKLNEYEKRENEILDELKNMNSINVSEYQRNLSTYRERIRNLQDEKARLLTRQGALGAAISESERRCREFQEKSNKNEIWSRYLSYARQILEWINQTYDEKESDIRTRLQNSVTELFNKIYTGQRKVIIDKSYNMSVVPSADTGGLMAIKYFSYVGGLVKTAKEIMLERQTGDTLFGGEYPLVLDAAFSHTDAKHTQAIATELANVTGQLVFAVMAKDWTHVESQIQNKIARTYKLVKVSEDEIIIEEL